MNICEYVNFNYIILKNKYIIYLYDFVPFCNNERLILISNLNANKKT